MRVAKATISLGNSTSAMRDYDKYTSSFHPLDHEVSMIILTYRLAKRLRACIKWALWNQSAQIQVPALPLTSHSHVGESYKV